MSFFCMVLRELWHVYLYVSLDKKSMKISFVFINIDH